MNHHIHFISDLHLTQDRPDITQWFLAYLDSLDHQVSALYILGDLFDVWVGDDDNSEPNQTVKTALKQTTEKNIQVYFIAGNRDFLIGQTFFQDTGVMCLKDHHVIDLFGQRALLMHGDLLCSDDVEYLQFRQMSHSEQWQQGMLSKPLEERLLIAQQYRLESKKNKAEKTLDIMDVNAQTVEQTMAAHGVQLLIHGHTHRPDVHQITVNDKPARRVVLAEWDTKASVLDWSKHGFVVHEFN